MTRLPQRPTELPGDLADIFREELSADDLAELTERTAQRHSRGMRRALRVPHNWPGRLPRWLLFAGGVLLGWLVIGWWLWPVHWTDSDPWEMSTRNQKVFVQLVADRYWAARDLAQAESNLGGWNRDDVNDLLVAMQAESDETEARQHLALLSEALRLPGGEQSLLTSILGQEGMGLALVLAAMPLLIAIGLVLVSKLRSPEQTEEERLLEQEGEADLEELLADVQLEGLGGQGGGEAGGDQAALPGAEDKPSEEQTPPEEDNEEQTDANNPLGDLASLFEEDDTSLTTLEAMCKGMPDVTGDDIIARARDVIRRFREERPKPA